MTKTILGIVDTINHTVQWISHRARVRQVETHGFFFGCRFEWSTRRRRRRRPHRRKASIDLVQYCSSLLGKMVAAGESSLANARVQNRTLRAQLEKTLEEISKIAIFHDRRARAQEIKIITLLDTNMSNVLHRYKGRVVAYMAERKSTRRHRHSAHDSVVFDRRIVHCRIRK